MADPIYIDTCVFIAIAKGEFAGPVLEGARSLMNDVESGKRFVYASTLTLLEMVTPDLDKFVQMFDGRKGELIETRLPIVKRARSLRGPYGAQKLNLDAIDAIHLATAEHTKCRVLVTTDGYRPDGTIKPSSFLALAGPLRDVTGVEVLTPEGFFSGQSTLDLPAPS